MESVVAQASDIKDICKFIQQPCHQPETYDKRNERQQCITATLDRFIQHALRNPAVLASPHRTQNALAQEVRQFLLAHIQHNHDNAAWRSQEPLAKNKFKWARSSAADDTSCPFAIRYFACLIIRSGENCLKAQALPMLAKVCVGTL